MSFKESDKSWLMIIILSVIIGLVGIYSIVGLTPKNKAKPGELSNPSFEKEANTSIGGDFNLVDMTGKEVSLKDYDGKFLMIYFGFTNCPDICPTSLQVMSRVMEILPPKDAIKIQPIFVSVDPKRDTPQKLQKYLSGNFHESIVGLTGSEEQIANVTKAYRIYHAKVDDSSADEDNYLINHTSLIYLTDENGHYLMHFSLEDQAEQVASRISEALK